MDKGAGLKILFLFSLASCMTRGDLHTPSPLSLESEAAFRDPMRISASSDADFAPDVAADGKTVFYTSDRLGNKDIWRKAVSSGAAEQITHHVADDLRPVVSPDGSKLAFISRRDDALGDLYVLDLRRSFLSQAVSSPREGSLRRLTRSDREDASPVWLPNSRGLVFASKGFGSALPEILQWDLEHETVTRIGSLLGSQPTLSPDGGTLVYVRSGGLHVFDLQSSQSYPLTAGGILQDGHPRFNEAGSHVLFIRYADDTNSDGVLNADDRPSLWRIPLRPENIKGVPVQHIPEILSSARFGAYSPVERGDWIYAAFEKEGGMNIYRIPHHGHLIPADDLDRIKTQIRGLTDIWDRLYLLRKAEAQLLKRGKVADASRLAMMEIRTQAKTGRVLDARLKSDEIKERYPNQKVLLTLAALELLVMEVRDQSYPGFLGERTVPQKRIAAEVKKRLDLLVQESMSDKTLSRSERERVAVSAGSLRAQLLANEKDYVGARQILDKLPSENIEDEEILGKAAILRARLSKDLDDDEAALRLLIEVAKNFSQDTDILQDASLEAIRIAAQSESPDAAMAKLVRDAGILPMMPAMAHLAIARRFGEAEKATVYTNELRQIVSQYETSPGIRLEAALELSKSLEREGKFAQAEGMWTMLHLSTAQHTPLQMRPLRKEMERYHLRSAEFFQLQKNYEMVKLACEKAIALDERSIQGHRCAIDASYSLKQQAKSVAFYEKRVGEVQPEASAVYLWAYALTYDVDGEMDLTARIAALDKVILYLEQARDLDGLIPQIHQTLGWAYLQRAHWRQVREATGGLTGAVRKRWDMVRGFFGRSEQTGLLRAIDAFETAYYLSPKGSLERASLAQNLGQTFYELKSYQKSLDYFLERIAVLDVFPTRDKRLEGALLRRAGRAAFQTENMPLAARLQREALRVWEKIGDDEQTAYSLDALALTYREMERFDAAEELDRRLLRLEERTGNLSNRIGTLTNLGYAAFATGRYEAALEHFAEAEKAIRTVQSQEPGDPRKEDQAAEAIQVDLGGEQSAAKGFGLFNRLNLVLSFRSIIYEKMGRMDLALREGQRKRLLLDQELRHRKGGPTRDLGEAQAILMNRLAYLAAQVGETGASVGYFEESSRLARKLREDKQNAPQEGELLNEVGLARLQLRRISLEGLEKAERGEALKRVKGVLAPIRSEARNAAQASDPWRLELLTLGAALERVSHAQGGAELGHALQEALSTFRSQGKPAGIREGTALMMAQLMPELWESQERSELDAAEEAPAHPMGAKPFRSWAHWAVKGDMLRAFEDLRKYVQGGGTFPSPMDRLAARQIFETSMDRYQIPLEREASLHQWLQYLQLRMVELSTRMAVTQGPGDKPQKVASIAAWFNDTSLEDVRAALGDEAAVLMAHKTLAGSLYFALLQQEGVFLWQGPLPVIDTAGVTRALGASGFGERLAKKKTLYIVPDGELFELAWEKVLVGGRALEEGMDLAFLPTPAVIPRLVAKKSLPRGRLGVLLEGASETQGVEKEIGSPSGLDITVVPRDGAETSGKSLEREDAVHVFAPLNLNDAEPQLSVFWGEKDEEKSTNAPLVSSLWRHDRKRKAFMAFPHIHRVTSHEKPRVETHEGWVFLFLGALQQGTPTVLMEFAREFPDPPSSSQLGTTRTNWPSFYRSLQTLSLRDSLKAADFQGRVLGALGLPTREEQVYAKEALSQVWEEAEDAYEEGQNDVAIDRLRETLHLSKVAGANHSEAILSKLIGAYFKRQDFKEAYFYQRKKSDFLRQRSDVTSRRAYGASIVDAAVLAVKSEKYSEATTLLNEAEAFYRGENNTKVLGKIDQYRAINAENTGAYEESIQWYTSARKKYLQVDLSEAAQRLLNIGNIYNARLSDFPRALEAYHQARIEFRKGGEKTAEMRVLVDISNALIATGDLAGAISILKEDLLPSLDENQDVDLWVRANQMLANAYLRSGQLDDAESLNEKNIVSVEKMHDIRDQEKKEQRLIEAWGLRAYLLAAQHRYKEAFYQFEQTIQIATDKNLPQPLAALLNNYGFWLREVGSLEKSVAMLEKAEFIDQKLKSRSGMAVDQRNLGLSLVALGDLSRAKDLLEQSLLESERLFLTYNSAFCHFGLGDIAMREGRLAEAESRFEKALALSQKGLMPDFEWRALAGMGRVRQELGRSQEALPVYQKAIDKIEEREGGLRSGASKNSFQSDAGVQEVYARYAHALMAQGNITAAWEISERARSRALIDVMGAKEIDVARPQSQDLQTRERRARMKVEDARRRVASLGGVGPAVQELAAAEKWHEAQLAKIEAEDFQLVDLLRVKPVSAQQFMRKIPRGIAVLSYMVTPSHILLWVLRDGVVHGTQVAMSAADLDRMIAEYRDLFENFSSPEYIGNELSKVLLEPVREWIQDAPHLVVIPHRSLHFLAFSSLPLGEKYLMEQMPISYMDSARLALFLWSQSERKRLTPNAKILALVNPERAAEEGPPLPFSAKEGVVLGRYFKSVTRLDKARATAAPLRRGTAGYDLLHLAAHGEFFPDAPSASRLLLAKEGRSDGALDIRAIVALPPQARMVTLSACQTGLGEISSGDEITSMDRAFFYAGARTVVSSLWRISDVASAVTMKRYYRYLAAGKSPAEALRMAQLVVKKYFTHPAYWSSFRVLGDGV